jgi:hypothetical protein
MTRLDLIEWRKHWKAVGVVEKRIEATTHTVSYVQLSLGSFVHMEH